MIDVIRVIMRKLLFVSAVSMLLITGCASQQYRPLPSLPKFNTQQDRAYARACQHEHTLCDSGCQRMIGGMITASQRKQCLSECNQKLEQCTVYVLRAACNLPRELDKTREKRPYFGLSPKG